jgi:hypothetical protein
MTKKQRVTKEVLEHVQSYGRKNIKTFLIFAGCKRMLVNFVQSRRLT